MHCLVDGETHHSAAEALFARGFWWCAVCDAVSKVHHNDIICATMYCLMNENKKLHIKKWRVNAIFSAFPLLRLCVGWGVCGCR